MTIEISFAFCKDHFIAFFGAMNPIQVDFLLNFCNLESVIFFLLYHNWVRFALVYSKFEVFLCSSYWAATLQHLFELQCFDPIYFLFFYFCFASLIVSTFFTHFRWLRVSYYFNAFLIDLWFLLIKLVYTFVHQLKFWRLKKRFLVTFTVLAKAKWTL